MNDVVAIACADIHLSHKAPIARSTEDDWYQAMLEYLTQLGDLAQEYDCPIICAGDIFDRWYSPPQLINFALEHLPRMFMIPGQHDLPNHKEELLDQSAYTSLLWSDQFQSVEDDHGEWRYEGCLAMATQAYGIPIEPPSYEPDPEKYLRVLVVHQYIHKGKGTCYPTAPKEAYVNSLRECLAGYDVAIFGDNHIGFITKVGKCRVINCGSLMNRNVDQMGRRPMVGLIHRDGTIRPHYLDTSREVWSVEESDQKAPEASEKIGAFIKTMQALDIAELDFRRIVRQYMDDEKVSEGVKSEILNAMGE